MKKNLADNFIHSYIAKNKTLLNCGDIRTGKAVVEKLIILAL
jgi:hypothetical protein